MNLRRPGVFIALMLLLVGIGAHPQQAAPRVEQQPAIKSSEGPAFTVKMSFSDKARTKLTEKSETVIVAAYFTGSPRKGAPKRFVDKMGEVGLGQAKREVAPGEDATFAEVKLQQDALKQIDEQGPSLLINVYSGRKSSIDNLLDCGIYEGALKAVQGKSIPIACKLIGE
jgi:hypothetical protein